MYNDLSDEAKIELAVEFVATEQPLPEPLKKWLEENGLYDLIVISGPDHGPRE